LILVPVETVCFLPFKVDNRAIPCAVFESVGFYFRVQVIKILINVVSKRDEFSLSYPFSMDKIQAHLVLIMFGAKRCEEVIGLNPKL
jgi:hypothetical protein